MGRFDNTRLDLSTLVENRQIIVGSNYDYLAIKKHIWNDIYSKIRFVGTIKAIARSSYD